MKKQLIALTIGITLLFGSYMVPAENTAMANVVFDPVVEGIITNGVNARAEPSTSSKILGTLSKGTKVKVLEEVSNGWVKISAYNRTGYVYYSYIYYSKSGQATSTTVQNTADKIIKTGQKYIGTPYKLGAMAGQTKTFDCSSFTQYIFGANGIKLPRNSREQATVGTSISSVSKLQKGDLIFFKTGARSDGKIDHVAVYMGDNKILHSIPNGGVQIASYTGFWIKTTVLVKRVI
jgi:cell wall-associated NlpC family hydrolase